MFKFTQHLIAPIIISVLLAASCVTSNQHTSSNAQTASLSQQHALALIINNRSSMTKSLKDLHHKFSIQLLHDGIKGNNYVRISALKLDDTPVVAAISSTSLNDPTFVDILRHASTASIGKRLFATNSPIKRRDNMKIYPIDVNAIIDPTIHSYLTLSLKYSSKQKIIARQSQFYYNNETMDLTEYILPTLIGFIPK